ncbi:acyltransferase ChoActase/COT/CPT [Amanita rubescens]|nr:acyltransferase ChoActase/COT/CPT [Amanita rubescens]
MLPFREMVESGQLEPEKARGTPMCMESYKWLQFERIIVRAADSPAGLPIGALTSDNRDLWTDARAALIAASPSHNATLLRQIESAMIIVVLDETKPVTREDISWNTWAGNAGNRWFDKHQLVVYDNGRSGFLGEHSCMDGTPTLRMNEYILATIALGRADRGPERNAETGKDLARPEELVFEVNGKVEELVKGAEQRYDELLAQHDMQVVHYEGYGKEFIKQFKLSPDAWTQLVKQLAFQKMFGRPGITYESAQTRKYQLGRTEVIRSASNESKEWAEAMSSSVPKDPLYLRDLFRKAVTRHMQYSSWAADAQGVDRHLFGLKRCLKEGEPVPEIYNDESFAKSNHWELSTSQLSSPYLDGWGYGEVVPDGYGLSYSIGDNYIRWTITSLKRHTAELGHYLAEAATEVKRMMESADKVEKKKLEAKL